MANQATVHALESEIVSRLAKFFPQATPVRIPVKLSRTGSLINADAKGTVNGDANGMSANSPNGPNRLATQKAATKKSATQENATEKSSAPNRESENVFFQNTVIEFGTPHEVLFAVDRPLEFADRILVESSDGSLHAEASVVAVQYHPKRTVVAARFLQNVPNWIVKS
ncbi:MAG TPA: hypothetical protein VJK27_12305 [Terriglobales bacterium]|nr:hypothetical protein [Terriglobales bacterium]